MPTNRKDFRIGGVLAKDKDTGRIALFHTGKIGGGRKGIGSKFFYEKYHGELYYRNDNGDIVAKGNSIGFKKKVVMIGYLEDDDFSKKVSTFVKEVHGIKKLKYPDG